MQVSFLSNWTLLIARLRIHVKVDVFTYWSKYRLLNPNQISSKQINVKAKVSDELYPLLTIKLATTQASLLHVDIGVGSFIVNDS